LECLKTANNQIRGSFKTPTNQVSVLENGICSDFSALIAQLRRERCGSANELSANENSEQKISEKIFSDRIIKRKAKSAKE
jgi:hypothetical protein